ncbi:hypothetical protein AgCh_033788 [Apium graveolens]
MDSFKSLLVKVNPGAPKPKDRDPLLLAPNDDSGLWGRFFDAAPESLLRLWCSCCGFLQNNTGRGVWVPRRLRCETVSTTRLGICLTYWGFQGLGRWKQLLRTKAAGRRQLLVKSIQNSHVIRCHVLNISRAAALGSIVRCGSDDDIDQVIIKKGLCLFKVWLSNKDKYIVKNACWIISNIAARKEDHIKAAIDFELIDPLVHIVENYESLDVKKEAAWAISNAIHGAGPDQIGDLRNRCVEPFWNLQKECHENQEIVSLCLEALVGLKGIDISCNDEPIDVVEWFKVFKKFMVRPETPQFQLAERYRRVDKIKEAQAY